MSFDSDWRSAASGFKRLDETQVHQGFVWSLATATFESPSGDTFQRDIVRSPGSVGVVPLVETAAGAAVTLIAQYRAPFEEAVIEIPAGMRDVDGEAPEATARRELVEEAGLHADRLYKVSEMRPSPGLTDSICTIYLAVGCTAVADARQGPEEQHMVVVELMLPEAIEMIDSGLISDAKSIVGLVAAKRFVDGDLRFAE